MVLAQLCGSPACRLPSQRTTRGQRRPAVALSTRRQPCHSLRVACRYAGGAGGSSGAPPPPLPPPQQQQQQFRPPPPQQPQQPFRPPPQQQQQRQQFQQRQQQQPQYPPPPLAPQQQQPPLTPAQRQQLPASRRIGVSKQVQQRSLVSPGQQPQQQAGAALQQLARGAAAAVGAVQPEVLATPVQALAGMGPPPEVLLSRSKLMDKELITRTNAKRLGYINQLFVDPGSLSVVSLYLRQAANSLTSMTERAADQEHVMLSSLIQIGDVVLVHDETVLSDPPADDSLGYCKLVGASVVTETGQELGRVRDYVFDPDTGAVCTIKFDQLGVPSLPQALFSCSSVTWEDVKQLGPTKLILYRGAEERAILENVGVVTNGLSLLIDLVVGPSADQRQAALEAAAAGGGARGALQTPVGDDQSYRSDKGYREWYEKFGREYEQSTGIKAPPPAGWQEPAAAPPPPRQKQQPPQRRAPAALPPPQTQTFAQAVQPQAQQAQQAQQGFQQQMFQQQQRQAVPAGTGGWGAPPPPQQQQYAAPPPQQQQYQYPPAQQQQQPGGPLRRQPQGPPPPQQQFKPSPAQQAQQQQRAQQAQQPLLPQNGIPIIDRTPPLPYRRRDIDGNYGTPPPAMQPPQQQQQQQGMSGQPRGPPGMPGQQQQQQRAQQQPRQGPPQQAPQARQAPVVEPDAVIPGGLAGGTRPGSAGGLTQVAEYRQL